MPLRLSRQIWPTKQLNKVDEANATKEADEANEANKSVVAGAVDETY
jgi:hypothetical protein